MNKDKRWNINTTDPGILRKKEPDATELLVFGYGCKIFRDDEKAREMDQGKHLIPWMGNDNLKIDRYDARGHLSETSQFDGNNVGYFPSAEEKRIEAMCDEERYRSLYHSEDEKEMYQEEELKRLKQAVSSDKEYGQVAYSYTDAAQTSTTEPESVSTASDAETEPFVPNPFLDIPSNMVVPATIIENQIIEKTANYVASFGPQVEILIKTRQANNPKLAFLHAGHPLNSFYHFILAQIKSGRYRPANGSQSDSDNQDNDHYLHPSLIAQSSTAVESAPSIPSIAYKPSSDCTYNMLVTKIRNVQQSKETNEAVKEEAPTVPESDTISQYSACSSNSSTSLPSRRKRRRRHPPSENGSLPDGHFMPPLDVRKIMTKFIHFTYSRNLNPHEFASNLLKKDYATVSFIEPGHIYHKYYLKKLAEIELMREKNKYVDMVQLQNQNVTEATYHGNIIDQSEHLNGFQPTVPTGGEVLPNLSLESNHQPSDVMYDPELPTETDIDTLEKIAVLPACNSTIEAHQQEEQIKTVIKTEIKEEQQSPFGDDDTCYGTSSEWDVPNQPPAKPAPVCFSIKKPRETERLEHASAFPIESSTTDEEEEEEKEPLLKSIETERQKIIEGDKEKHQHHSANWEERVKDKLAQVARENLAAKGKEKYKRSEKPYSKVANGLAESPTQLQGSNRAKDYRSSERRMMNGKVGSSQSQYKRSRTREDDVRGEKRRKICPETITSGALNHDSRTNYRSIRSGEDHKSSEGSSKVGNNTSEFSSTLLSDSISSPLASSTPYSKADSEIRKREERKKKLLEMYKKIANGLDKNGTKDRESQPIKSEPVEITLQNSPTPSTTAESAMSIEASRTFLPNVPGSAFSDLVQITKEKVTTEDPKKNEERLRNQVKKSLREIARTTLASIPKVTEQITQQVVEEAIQDVDESSDTSTWQTSTWQTSTWQTSVANEGTSKSVNFRLARDKTSNKSKQPSSSAFLNQDPYTETGLLTPSSSEANSSHSSSSEKSDTRIKKKSYRKKKKSHTKKRKRKHKGYMIKTYKCLKEKKMYKKKPKNASTESTRGHLKRSSSSESSDSSSSESSSDDPGSSSVESDHHRRHKKRRQQKSKKSNKSKRSSKPKHKRKRRRCSSSD